VGAPRVPPDGRDTVLKVVVFQRPPGAAPRCRALLRTSYPAAIFDGRAEVSGNCTVKVLPTPT